MSIPKIGINFSHHYTRHILFALQSVSKNLEFIIEDDKSIAPEHIYVNNELIGLIAWYDCFPFNNIDLPYLENNYFKIIFKFHYSPNLFDYSLYGRHEHNIVGCGLWRTWESESSNYKWNKKNILNRERPIDVSAQMRHINSSKIWHDWSNIRFQLKKVAEKMNGRFNTRFKMINREKYEAQLLNTKLAFIWSASAYLGWKIPEFLEQGVIMITEPLGKDFPLCNGVILEDNVHCVFCDDPNKFEEVAISLLKDPERMHRIRKNILDLWEEKLTQKMVGKWYYKKIIEAYNE